MIMGPLDVIDGSDASQPPGTVLEAHGDRLLIACGQGAVAPRSIQLAGKRAMTVAELLRGHPIQPGERFGPEESRL